MVISSEASCNNNHEQYQEDDKNKKGDNATCAFPQATSNIIRNGGLFPLSDFPFKNIHRPLLHFPAKNIEHSTNIYPNSKNQNNKNDK